MTVIAKYSLREMHRPVRGLEHQASVRVLDHRGEYVSVDRWVVYHDPCDGPIVTVHLAPPGDEASS